MLTRRLFLGGMAATAAATATASEPAAPANPQVDHGIWPQTYHLQVQLPHPANRPLKVDFGIGFFIDRPTETVRCEHVGCGVYIGDHRGMKLRAIAEHKDGNLICRHAAWEGTWSR